MNGYHLITGGSGFIGRHVAFALADAGKQVLIASRAPLLYSIPERLRQRISWVPMHVETANWDALVDGAEVVHHYAWTSLPASANANPLGDLDINVLAAIALLEALRRRGGGRIVFSSSGGTIYGKLTQVPVPEEHSLRPITAYGAGKATAELYLGLYRELYGIDCRIARIANPYGADQNVTRGQGAATKFALSALLEAPIVIWGDGEVVRDYLHVSELAGALVALSLCEELGDDYIFNIGGGQGTSLNQIVSNLELLLGRQLQVTREPGRRFDVPVSVLCIARARSILQWAPSLSILEGLRLTLSGLTARLREEPAVIAMGRAQH